MIAEVSRKHVAISMARGLQLPFQRRASPQENDEHVVHVLHVPLALKVALSEYG
jgi:hypothetical protein